MKVNIKNFKTIVALILLQFILDVLYAYLYPSVNPIRATLIGISAFFILFIPIIQKLVKVSPFTGFIPIYSSAFFGALLVQSNIIKSKSIASGLAHILILVVTYTLIVIITDYYKKNK